MSTQLLHPSLLCISPKLLRLRDFKQVTKAVSQEFEGETRYSWHTKPPYTRCHLLQFISAMRELGISFPSSILRVDLSARPLPADGLAQST